jgi:Protein of unknown function (DUF2848)
MSNTPDLEFEFVSANGRLTMRPAIHTLVIAGWTGRDPSAVEKHIQELEELGVARPKSTPVFYRVSASRLTQSSRLEVPGRDSTGEVEFVLLRYDRDLYLGLGSDHTDRKVEIYSVTLSKQLCDKPVARQLWRLDHVRSHWDRLVLKSWIEVDGKRIAYQEGPVTAMLDPETILQKYESENGELPDGAVMFCGTLATEGGVRFSKAFMFELCDGELGRSIEHSYQIEVLPVRG